MKIENIMSELEEQLRSARAKFPSWSLDPVHGAAIVAEQAGEALQAALDFYYERGGGAHQLKKELFHTLTMAVRFLMNFEASERWMENFKTGREEAEALKKLREEKKNGEREV